MKSHEQFICDHSISSNSPMVVEKFENVEYEITKDAMKLHE